MMLDLVTNDVGMAEAWEAYLQIVEPSAEIAWEYASSRDLEEWCRWRADNVWLNGWPGAESGTRFS